jgi:hypothetical protein
LRLEHSGFPPDSFAFKAMSGAWRKIVSERIPSVAASLA